MENLIVPWSKEMSNEELEYKDNGFSKTKGSIFDFKPPSDKDLINAFNLIRNELSVGAIALCKHEGKNYNKIFSYCKDYPEMKGNKDSKNKITNDFIVDFLNKKIIWKNVHVLNNKIIFELRNELNLGVRWYLMDDKVVFRGILEPYITYLEFKKNKNDF